MTATSLDLSQIRTDALSSAATFRSLIGLGSGDTPTFKGATLSTGTITASTPAVDISQTWNNAGVTFTASKVNVTDTASNAASLLADWQVDGISRFSFSKNNSLLVGTTSSFAQVHFKPVSGAAYLAIQAGSGTFAGIYLGDSSGDFSHRILRQGNDQDFRVIGAMSFYTGLPSTERFSISGTGLAVFTGGLEQRNLANAQTFRIYNTTDSGIANYERGKLEWSSNVLKIGTEKAGTGSARALEFQTDGTTRLTIGTTGNTTLANGYLYFEDANGYITRTSATNTMTFAPSNASGAMQLSSGLMALYGTLRFGVDSGATTNYTISGSNRGGNNLTAISLTISGGNGTFAGTGNAGGNVLISGGAAIAGNNNGGFVYLDGGLNNGSGSTGDVVIGNTRGNLQLADARNVIVGTTTGTKIGTATTQKLGFYNATPVVQPTAVADATDAASVITQLNALLSRMRDLGLIAT